MATSDSGPLITIEAESPYSLSQTLVETDTIPLDCDVEDVCPAGET
jgi:hypothetical protein